MKLNQECILLQGELRKFAQNVLLDKVDEFDKTCVVPTENINQLAEMGILGAVVPEEMDGAALELIGLAVSIEELAKVCSSTALVVAAHNGLFAFPILKFGNDEMKKKHLPQAAVGQQIGGAALIQTNEFTLRKEGENYILNGTNPFVLNAEMNGPFSLFCATGESNELTAFIVDAGSPQVKREKNNQVLGIKAGGIGQLTFENLILTPQHRLGQEHGGHEILDATQSFMKICLSAIAVGIGQGAADEAVKYAKERIQFEQPISNFGMVREKIADMNIRIEAGRHLTYDAALRYDAGEAYRHAASLAKYYTGQSAVEITTQAIQVFGGYGYMKDYPVERYFRDAHVINVLCSAPADEMELIAQQTIG
jgi:butyryl-CoA dehydrogenase